MKLSDPYAKEELKNFVLTLKRNLETRFNSLEEKNILSKSRRLVGRLRKICSISIESLGC
jgi:hypothetical protein